MYNLTLLSVDFRYIVYLTAFSIIFSSLSVLAVLWVLFFIGAYKISQFEKDFTEYDPYAVLELDRVSNQNITIHVNWVYICSM